MKNKASLQVYNYDILNCPALPICNNNFIAFAVRWASALTHLEAKLASLFPTLGLGVNSFYNTKKEGMQAPRRAEQWQRLPGGILSAPPPAHPSPLQTQAPRGRGSEV